MIAAITATIFLGFSLDLMVSALFVRRALLTATSTQQPRWLRRSGSAPACFVV
jgi:hypothetical protein